jgi:hypothetical protein
MHEEESRNQATMWSLTRKRNLASTQFVVLSLYPIELAKKSKILYVQCDPRLCTNQSLTYMYSEI